MSTCRAVAGPLPEAVRPSMRDLLSLREVVILADVPEKRVRKDLETGILTGPRVVRLPDARLCFAWHHVFVVAAVYGNSLINTHLRKIAIKRVDDALVSDGDFEIWCAPNRFVFECKKVDRCERSKFLEIDRYLTLDLSKVSHSVKPRVGIYAAGLGRIEERNDILGGDAVFKNTRLPVAHIGKMIVDGEKISNVVEDFPQLNEDDVRFAELYYRAHPPIGRPRVRGGCDDAMLGA